MYVLLLLSILATAIVLLKGYHFFQARLRQTDFIDRAIERLEQGDVNGALDLLHPLRHPVARVMERAIRFGRDPRYTTADTEAEISRVGSAEIRALESWLRALSSIAHLSPLLGLLGTVTGMIDAFMNLETAGSRIDPALLSGGIWEALLTTAFGLTVAIPAMAAFYYFEGEVDQVRAEMKDAAVRILRLFGKSPHIDDRDQHPLEDEPHGL